jgi:dimethylargininase
LNGENELFRRAVVREPGINFAEGLTSAALGAPDVAVALAQHEAYCRALEFCGLELLRLPPDLRHPDSTFVEDTAVLARRSAILARPGTDSRLGEVAAIRDAIRPFFSAIHEIQSPGTLDGGDICEAGSHFFIGVSHRTNEEGARQLGKLLAAAGFTSSTVDIRGMHSILHLKSGIAYLDNNVLVVMDELAGREEFRGYDLIRVASDESYACNCVLVNERVLVPEGFPRLQDELTRRGFVPLALDISEFRKMDGGLSCLSLRF